MATDPFFQYLLDSPSGYPNEQEAQIDYFQQHYDNDIKYSEKYKKEGNDADAHQLLTYAQNSLYSLILHKMEKIRNLHCE